MLNVRSSKKVLKLNFNNWKDDSRLKMQAADSLNISVFLSVLELQVEIRQLASRNRFFHPLTGSLPLVDLNLNDESQFLDRLKHIISYLSLDLRQLMSIRETITHWND